MGKLNLLGGQNNLLGGCPPSLPVIYLSASACPDMSEHADDTLASLGSLK